MRRRYLHPASLDEGIEIDGGEAKQAPYLEIGDPPLGHQDSGLLSFPFTKIEANRNWMATVMMAADLVRWFQFLCLDGFWAKARPKALRWGLFHAPGRLVRTARQQIVRILDGWPSAGALLGAYQKMAVLC